MCRRFFFLIYINSFKSGCKGTHFLVTNKTFRYFLHVIAKIILILQTNKRI